MSLPYKGYPASSRSVSRAPSPQGPASPAPTSACHSVSVSAARAYSSKPSSPVYPVHEGVAVRARDLEFAHVGYIEHPHTLAHRPVLGGDPGRVAHGHLVPAERHHLGAERDVDLVQRRALRTLHGLP